MSRSIEEIINRQIHRWNNMRALLRRPDADLEPDDPAVAAAEPECPVHPVICISRDIGAGARAIAQGLCEELHYELFGSRSIHAIANDLKVQKRLIESLDECSRDELGLMLESFLQGHEIESSDYLRSLTRVVQALALQGGVVLLGRGAGFILRDRSALNVYVTAPLVDRIARVCQYEKFGEAAARARIVEADKERRRFLKQFFDVNPADPTQYDLIVNTRRVPPVAATELILAALRVRGFVPQQIALPEAVLAHQTR